MLVWPRYQRHHKTVAIGDRRLFDGGRLDEPISDRVQQFHPQVAMLHLASAEHDGDADLVVRRDKLADVLDLDVKVVRADMRLEAHFLEQTRLLLLARLPLLLVLLVLELRVVEDLADRRIRLRGDLDEIESLLAGQGQGFSDRFDADLSAVRVDKTDFLGRDPLIDASSISVLVKAAAELVDGSPVSLWDWALGPK
jgi:hypothetical protein